MNKQPNNLKAVVLVKIKKELKEFNMLLAAFSTVIAILIGGYLGLIINFFKSKTK